MNEILTISSSIPATQRQCVPGLIYTVAIYSLQSNSAERNNEILLFCFGHVRAFNHGRNYFFFFFSFKNIPPLEYNPLCTPLLQIAKTVQIRLSVALLSEIHQVIKAGGLWDVTVGHTIIGMKCRRALWLTNRGPT